MNAADKHFNGKPLQKGLRVSITKNGFDGCPCITIYSREGLTLAIAYCNPGNSLVEPFVSAWAYTYSLTVSQHGLTEDDVCDLLGWPVPEAAE